MRDQKELLLDMLDAIEKIEKYSSIEILNDITTLGANCSGSSGSCLAKRI